MSHNAGMTRIWPSNCGKFGLFPTIPSPYNKITGLAPMPGDFLAPLIRQWIFTHPLTLSLAEGHGQWNVSRQEIIYILAEDSCICVWHALAFSACATHHEKSMPQGNAASPAWVLGRRHPVIEHSWPGRGTVTQRPVSEKWVFALLNNCVFGVVKIAALLTAEAD